MLARVTPNGAARLAETLRTGRREHHEPRLHEQRRGDVPKKRLPARGLAYDPAARQLCVCDFKKTINLCGDGAGKRSARRKIVSIRMGCYPCQLYIAFIVIFGQNSGWQIERWLALSGSLVRRFAFFHPVKCSGPAVSTRRLSRHFWPIELHMGARTVSGPKRAIFKQSFRRLRAESPRCLCGIHGGACGLMKVRSIGGG